MKEHLRSVNVGNTFLRLKFNSDDLYNYQRTLDIERDEEIVNKLQDLAQIHFLSDKRFNLPEQKVYNVSVSFYRSNDKDYVYSISYSVGLGSYGDHKYKGNIDKISQALTAPQEIVDWFVSLEKEYALSTGINHYNS